MLLQRPAADSALCEVQGIAGQESRYLRGAGEGGGDVACGRAARKRASRQCVSDGCGKRRTGAVIFRNLFSGILNMSELCMRKFWLMAFAIVMSFAICAPL